MAQLWGGRFTKETDQLVYNFNASITFDKRFYKQDIRGSLAHVAMLAKQGILTEEEKEQITDGLNGILKDVESGKLEISDKYEDIHSFVEATLIDRIGDPGKKLHTGRSRNDQVALDMKLFTRDEIQEIDAQVKELLEVILHVMEENVETYMPGFTHLQKAQPITLAHHMGAYFEMFRRDHERLKDISKRMNTCPLGSGALAGTTYPLDREYTAELLGFDGPTLNSMDGVSDRDYLLELLSALSIMMMHLSRFCEEVIIWNSNEYQFVEIDDAYSTGSSIMPQKKNPFTLEHVKGKAAHLEGFMVSILTAMKNVIFSHCRDISVETPRYFWTAMQEMEADFALLDVTLRTLSVKPERMLANARRNFCTVTELANYLVRHDNVSFREAHEIIANVVGNMCERGLTSEDINAAAIDEVSQRDFGFATKLTDELVREALDPCRVVADKKAQGGTAPEEVNRQLDLIEKAIESDAAQLAARQKLVSEAGEKLTQAVEKIIAANPA
mgnify:CR=1 FL=1